MFYAHSLSFLKLFAQGKIGYHKRHSFLRIPIKLGHVICKLIEILFYPRDRERRGKELNGDTERAWLLHELLKLNTHPQGHSCFSKLTQTLNPQTVSLFVD